MKNTITLKLSRNEKREQIEARRLFVVNIVRSSFSSSSWHFFLGRRSEVGGCTALLTVIIVERRRERERGIGSSGESTTIRFFRSLPSSFKPLSVHDYSIALSLLLPLL